MQDHAAVGVGMLRGEGFLGSLVSKFQRFTKCPVHVFRKTSAPYPRISTFDSTVRDFGGDRFCEHGQTFGFPFLSLIEICFEMLQGFS